LHLTFSEVKRSTSRGYEVCCLHGYACRYDCLDFRLYAVVRLALSEQRRKELYAKQGRGNQFRSKEERDRWIGKEIKSLNKAVQDKEGQITRLKTDLAEDQEKAQKLELDIKVGGLR